MVPELLALSASSLATLAELAIFVIAAWLLRRQVSPYTVRTDNHPKVRFWVTVGEDPEIEVACVMNLPRKQKGSRGRVRRLAGSQARLVITCLMRV